ncbi:hypothetical protein [Mycobacterium sp.]|uniref:hypothetical protein n=1 Tax=Mycobacterium sp. TaxID=1785 RepID=UPI003F9D29DC
MPSTVMAPPVPPVAVGQEPPSPPSPPLPLVSAVEGDYDPGPAAVVATPGVAAAAGVSRC